ncbi:MAG: nitroreductase family protein [Bacteroidales bacterium]
MDFLQLAQKRRSVRLYADKILSREQLLQIAEAGRLAPSAVNFQPWEFTIVTTDEGLSGLYECYNREWFCKCKYAIVVCANLEEAWVRASDEKSHADIDAAIAIDHITLQATDMGIGSCWICNFDPVILRRNLELPDHLVPVAIVSLGFPANDDVWEQPKKRKEAAQIIKWK